MAAGVLTVLVLGGAGGGYLWSRHHRHGAAQPATKPVGSTAEVVRTDLTVRDSIDGTLGYAGSAVVYAQSVAPSDDRSAPPSDAAGKGAADAPSAQDRSPSPGVFTGLPTVGRTVTRGHALYAVNGVDVPLFYGGAPLWRTLGEGVDDGPDVRRLEQNLAALGYTGFTVDEHFTSATAGAVERWQRDLGHVRSGVVEPSDVAVQPGAVRITSVQASLGAPAQGQVATVSGTDRVVTVNLPVDRQTLARKGAAVSVGLPDHTTTAGRITSVGTVATGQPGAQSASGRGGSAPSATAEPTIEVRIALDRPSDAGTLDGAPVTVGFASETHKDVLAVPVNALMADPGGGYAVETVDAAGGTRMLRVTTGLFASGRVEVSGPGLAAGTKVQVPTS
ncbi:MAG: peptidoglycan-binding protein [Streptomyces sp.]|nr:peptidoglycan-binding protein [Streptomyces sp.]